MRALIRRTFALSAFSVLGCAAGRSPPAETPMATVVPSGASRDVPFGREVACQAGVEGDYCNLDKPPQVGPEITVSVEPFAIDTHEVTNLQWAHCMAHGACSKPRAFNIPGANPIDDYFDEEGTGHPNEPVVNITWEMADAYCKFHGKRLPTEVEWETAARSGSNGPLYPWGDTPGDCAQKSVALAACNNDHNFPQPVTGAMVDDQIIIDGKTVEGLAGNVSEWVADAYVPFLGCVNPAEPMDGLKRAELSGNGDPLVCKSAYQTVEKDDCGGKTGGDFASCAATVEKCQDCRDEADESAPVAPECAGQCLDTNAPIWLCKKPTAPVAGLVGTGGDERSVRGGNYGTSDLCEARSTDRMGRKLSKKEFRPFIGFRCARSL